MSVPRYIFISILFFVFALGNEGVYGSQHESSRQYRFGQAEGMSESERKYAIETLENALDDNRHCAETHAKLTELYMEEGTLLGRVKAERHIRRAIQKDAQNALYRLLYGKLKMKQGFRYAAKTEFNAALELDPGCADAYYHLGVICEKDVWRYRDMIDGPLRFDHFAEKDEQKSIDYFHKALEIDPNHRNALFHLGLVYCEREAYEEMAGLFQKIIGNEPDDKDAHLFFGLALYRQGRGAEAWEEYELARTLMEEDERTVFESIEGLLSPVEEEQYVAASLDEQHHLAGRFWHQQDPLFLTEYNERLLEHYSRVAYANLRYSYPERGIGGWETDQGKVYIRYGPPLRRVRSRPSIEPGIKDPVRTSIEVWRYGDFDHVFEDMFLTGEYRFKWGSRPETDGLCKYTTLIKDIPQFFEYDYGGEMFNIPCALAGFRGEGNKTSVDVCYALPARYLEYTVEGHESRTSVEVGAFFFDDDWGSVLRDVRDEELITGRIDPLKEYDIVSQRTVMVDPGGYHFALEARDRRSDNIGLVRDSIAVSEYGYVDLQLSDILFAADIQPSTGAGALCRGDYDIVPNPRKRYARSQPVFIYYEIYNLQLDVFGQTHYEVEYEIGPEPERPGGLSKLLQEFGDLIGARQKKGFISATSENKGLSATEFKFLRIDINDVPPEATVLTLSIRDLNGKQAAKKENRFVILD